MNGVAAIADRCRSDLRICRFQLANPAYITGDRQEDFVLLVNQHLPLIKQGLKSLLPRSMQSRAALTRIDHQGLALAEEWKSLLTCLDSLIHLQEDTRTWKQSYAQKLTSPWDRLGFWGTAAKEVDKVGDMILGELYECSALIQKYFKDVIDNLPTNFFDDDADPVDLQALFAAQIANELSSRHGPALEPQGARRIDEEHRKIIDWLRPAFACDIKYEGVASHYQQQLQA